MEHVIRLVPLVRCSDIDDMELSIFIKRRALVSKAGNSGEHHPVSIATLKKRKNEAQNTYPLA